MFRKFPSIEVFANVVKQVRTRAKYAGVPLPTINYEAVTKIHGCVHSDSLITLADGSVEMIKDITPGTSILSYNEVMHEYEFDVVDNVIVQNLDKPWVELEFDDGSVLKCTADHPILTTNGWVEAQFLEHYHTIVTRP